MYEKITYERKDNIAIITLNDPGSMNAISPPMITELHSALDEIENNPEVRVLAFYGGNEKYFSAGGNIKSMLEFSDKDAYETSKRTHDIYSRLEDMNIPTIAFVGGLAFGGGLELSMACDFRIVSEKAKFGLTESSLGLIPGGGGTYRLGKFIGQSKAKEYMFLGTVFNALQANEMGLVTRLAPAGETFNEGMKFAAELAKRAPVSLSFIKKLMRQCDGKDRDSCDELEAKAFGELFNCYDSKEGMRAFLEKRDAVWTGK